MLELPSVSCSWQQCTIHTDTDITQVRNFTNNMTNEDNTGMPGRILKSKFWSSRLKCSLQIVGVDMIWLSSSERRHDKNACLELHVLISLEKHGWPGRQQYSGWFWGLETIYDTINVPVTSHFTIWTNFTIHYWLQILLGSRTHTAPDFTLLP